jgi:N-methylhydantoinase B
MRGGLGYHKRIRVLSDAQLLSNADRSLINTYGLRGGKAGGRYGIAIERDGEREDIPGLADNVPLSSGDVIEIVTTGGGGWGDPLERDHELVRWDVIRGVVSVAAAREEYGVVLVGGEDPAVDVEATMRLRAELAVMRQPPAPGMFDRGPYVQQAIECGLLTRPAAWEDPDS